MEWPTDLNYVTNCFVQLEIPTIFTKKNKIPAQIIHVWTASTI